MEVSSGSLYWRKSSWAEPSCMADGETEAQRGEGIPQDIWCTGERRRGWLLEFISPHPLAHTTWQGKHFSHPPSARGRAIKQWTSSAPSSHGVPMESLFLSLDARGELLPTLALRTESPGGWENAWGSNC